MQVRATRERTFCSDPWVDAKRALLFLVNGCGPRARVILGAG